MSGYAINPLDKILFGAELLGKSIDSGTISVGVSGSGSILAIAGASGNVGLAMDRQGDVGVTISYGGYAGNPSASIVGFLSISSASDLEDLNGPSH